VLLLLLHSMRWTRCSSWDFARYIDCHYYYHSYSKEIYLLDTGLPDATLQRVFDRSRLPEKTLVALNLYVIAFTYDNTVWIYLWFYRSGNAGDDKLLFYEYLIACLRLSRARYPQVLQLCRSQWLKYGRSRALLHSLHNLFKGIFDSSRNVISIKIITC